MLHFAAATIAVIIITTPCPLHRLQKPAPELEMGRLPISSPPPIDIEAAAAAAPPSAQVPISAHNSSPAAHAANCDASTRRRCPPRTSTALLLGTTCALASF